MSINEFDALFQPLRVGGITLRNRVLSTAHTSGAGEDGKPKERYQAYHEEKAKGGIGLTMIGGSTAVAPDTPGADMLHLDASTDEIIPFYGQLAARVHKHGAAVFAQLAHMGRRANWDNQHWLSPVGPSLTREPAHRSFPKAAEISDITRLVSAFAAGARRVKLGGIDGVELSATHGHIVDQFWSPRVNKRTDRYGGSLANRVRFSLEVLHAMRKAVGDDFVLGIRMSGDELIDGGLAMKDCLAIARLMVEEGTVDYVSVLAAQAENLSDHADIFPNMSMPSAPYLYVANAMKQEIDVPVFHAQRIADIHTAARIVREGQADAVAMTRGHLADPHIVRKAQEGRADDIRPCIGANYCIDRLYSGGQAYCLHNAATGREQTLSHIPLKAVSRHRVAVVGGGVGGLEAARVLASRGHHVTLVEKQPVLGGQVRTAVRLAWRESLMTIVRWQEMQVRKLGVEVRTGIAADAAWLAELHVDDIILATGGRANLPDIPGARHALTPWQALALGGDLTGQRFLVFDDNGREAAASCAEHLAEHGAEVCFMTADPHPLPLLERTTRPTFMRHLHERGVRFMVDSRLQEITRDGTGLSARSTNEYTAATQTEQYDRIVIDYGTVPDETLYEELKPASRNRGELDLDALIAIQPQAIERNPAGTFRLYRIGDAVSSRNIHAAVYDAYRLASAI
jgi:2,4-dienoyl-CoA reductase-like NADH-dependent reductase (Old Yellow Enzyme family)/pyruvate/2-oxoglutarate dehydrogenase complex dihydrolipoamide dehydrogenase (E3) component